MSERGEKTYRPWEPERYRQDAHSPVAKLPERGDGPVTVSISFSGRVTPRIVKSPSTSKVSGLVWTTFVDRNLITGLFLASKKFLPLSLLFCMPLPVSTLAA